MFFTMLSVNTLYQFWIHTRLIGRLGPLEWVFNTPSHHRVHHGTEPKYIDKNHGGTLIIWDRLFGTFQAEEEEPTYGITKPLKSWNPIWANLHFWAEMISTARSAARWSDKLRVFVAKPGWTPVGAVYEGSATPSSSAKYDPAVSGLTKLYATLQLATLVPVTVAIKGSISGAARPAVAIGLVMTLVLLGGLLEARRWALVSEGARLALISATAVALYAGGGVRPEMLAAVSVFVVFSAGCLLRLSRDEPRSAKLAPG